MCLLFFGTLIESLGQRLFIYLRSAPLSWYSYNVPNKERDTCERPTGKDGTKRPIPVPHVSLTFCLQSLSVLAPLTTHRWLNTKRRE